MEAIITLFTEGFIYVQIYLIIFCFVILESSRQYSNLSHLMAWVIMCILTLFIGLRWETGTDWEPYKALFDTLELDWSFLINVYHFDVGYVLFNALVRFFTDSYVILLLINAFITIYLLYRLIIKISPYPNLSLFLFYIAFMLSHFMGSNRRMMAMVFVLWALYFLFQKRRSYFFILVGLAFLFHRSAIISLIALIVPRNIFFIKRTLILLISSLVIGLLQLPAKLIEISGYILSNIISNPLVEKMLFYSEEGDEHLASSTGNLVISTILAVVKRSLFLMFYFYIMRRHTLDKLTQYIFNIYIFGFAGYLMFIGSFFQMLTPYFAISEIILLSRMYFYSNGKAKLVILFVILVYGFFQLLSALNVYPDLYMPYISCFSDQTRAVF